MHFWTMHQLVQPIPKNRPINLFITMAFALRHRLKYRSGLHEPTLQTRTNEWGLYDGNYTMPYAEKFPPVI